jgi:PadR family transcriptional regulator, regulatory protein PadR
MGSFKPTLQAQRVLAILLNEPLTEHYGLEIAKKADLASGSIYPILARLETAGWLASGWEDIDEAKEGRRRRRYYQLTAIGKREALRALEATKRQIFPHLIGELG